MKTIFGFLKKYFTLLLMVLLVVMGVVFYVQRSSYQDQITKLHNEIALSSKTIEVQKNTYAKKTAEIEDLLGVLKTFESDKDRDSKVIKKLRKDLKKRDEGIIAANRLVVKWKIAYAEVADSTQEHVPGDTDDPDSNRTKIDFEKDFGYISVGGHTLTDPAYAYVWVEQNRPLALTMVITQSSDRSWNTYVVSSEDDVGVDVKLSAVNPFIFKPKWHEKISVDFGMDMTGRGIYPYIGLSYPVGPVSLSSGLWGDAENEDLSWYAVLNYSWAPFARR